MQLLYQNDHPFVYSTCESRFKKTFEWLEELYYVKTIGLFALDFYVTIRLGARDFYVVIVDETEGRINYHLIEIKSE